jgi:hypothetical protein
MTTDRDLGREYEGDIQCCDIDEDYCTSFATGVVLFERGDTCDTYFDTQNREGQYAVMANRCASTQELLQGLVLIRMLTHASFYSEIVGLAWQVLSIVFLFAVLNNYVLRWQHRAMIILVITEIVQAIIQLCQTSLQVAIVGYVVSSDVFVLISQLINEGRCFSRTADGVLIGFKNDFELKISLGLGELALSFGGIVLAFAGVRGTWRSMKRGDDTPWENMQMAIVQMMLGSINLYLASVELHQLTEPGFLDFFAIMNSVFTGDDVEVEGDMVTPCLKCTAAAGCLR